MIFYTLFLLYYASYVYNTQATQKEAGQAVAKVSGLAVAGNGRGEGVAGAVSGWQVGKGCGGRGFQAVTWEGGR